MAQAGTGIVYDVAVLVTNTSAGGGARTFRAAMDVARTRLEAEDWRHVRIDGCRQVRLPDSGESAGWGGFEVAATVTDSEDAF